MYIICFNGPPRAGKDTLANLVAQQIEQRSDAPVRMASLSQPLRTIAFSMVGLTYDESQYEDFKTRYFERLDRTGRQLLIDVSESFLKPTYGETIMADLLIQTFRGYPSNTVVLVRDSGFQLEVNPLIREVGVENVMVVQLHRTGCDFSNDSREWVFHPTNQNMQIMNNGSLYHLEMEAGRLLFRLQNQFGWKF
jgi:hypothetical protein